MTATPLRIDIISDVVCPWCIIGYRQLMQAVKDTGVAVDVNWHPFELNPKMSPEGQNLTEHVAEKYGASAEESEANRVKLTDLGTELGFDFNFTPDMRMHNTFNAHQILFWAKKEGRSDDMKQALFTAHFTHQRDLSDDAVLADIAGEIGLDRDTAAAVLADKRYASAVRGEEKFWIRNGITGVPAVVFNAKHLVVGAQGRDNFASILNQLATAKPS